MGDWSDPIYYPQYLSGLLDRYFQYRVILGVGNAVYTPALDNITLNWDPYGIEGDPAISEYALLGSAPNPAYGTVSIRFGVPEPSHVNLSVFDISGRLVGEAYGDEYSPGFHDVQLDDLSSGIYFCRMVAGDFAATQRFVVLD